MIQLGVELRLSNPILAISALRRLETTYECLQSLAEYWDLAGSIVKLFNKSSIFRHSARGSIDRRHSTAHPTQIQEISTARDHPWDRSQNPKDPPELDILSSAADAAVERIAAGIIEQEHEEVSDWKQLFPFAESHNDQIFTPGDLMLMENEWRDMYWQEFTISGSINDGIGIWY
jgi:hypothetical protein